MDGARLPQHPALVGDAAWRALRRLRAARAVRGRRAGVLPARALGGTAMEHALLLDLGGSLAETTALAAEAEAAGLDAVYGIEGGREPFVPLTAMAAATERITPGTYVANAYAPTPRLTRVTPPAPAQGAGGPRRPG